MKFLFNYLVVFNSVFVFSQETDIQVKKEVQISGINLLKNEDITFEIFEFPERIQSVYFDSISNYLTLRLQGLSKNEKWLNNSGKIVQYDLKTNKVLWTKKIIYSNQKLLQKNNQLLFYKPNSTFKLDIQTGEKIWKSKLAPYFIDIENDIILGYKTSGLETLEKDVTGVNLSTGKKLWERKITNEYGWNDFEKLNDSIALIKAAGLHTINLKTGNGWDYETQTGYKDHIAGVVGNVLGGTAAVLTGTFVGSSGYNLIRDVVSNTIEDSTSYYLASKDQIAKINKDTGNVSWSNKFEKKIASESTIFEKGNIIYLVNYGKSQRGNKVLKIGKAFFAAFDKNDGKQVFNYNLENENIIDDFENLEKSILILSNNQILEIHKKEGTIKNQFKFDAEKFGSLYFFVDKTKIRKIISDEINKLNTENCFLLNENGIVYEFNYTLGSKLAEVSIDQFVFKKMDFDNIQFFNKDNQIFITDTNKVISKIYMSERSFIQGKYIWDIIDNKVKRVLIEDLR